LENMKQIFEPRSVAVIGASNNIKKWGCIIFGNLLLGEFRGELYPVNPTEPEIMGFKTYRRLAEIGRPVDLAVIVTPAHTVKEIVKECVDARVAAGIIITSGFRETGEEGKKLEEEILSLAREGGMRIVGPNTMGIFSAPASLLALMGPLRLPPGEVALISQSGNLGVQIVRWGSALGIKFRAFVSTGNQGDLSSMDYLRYFSKDPGTRAILLYIEGIDRGSLFLETLRETTKTKPVVIMKGGKTRTGLKAAGSHTGALAGDRFIIDSALKQSGAILVNDTEEFLDLACAILHVPPPKGNRMAILTRGGGWGVVAADRCEDSGLAIPPLTDAMKGELDRFLPPYWSHANPVDMVATLRVEAYNDCLKLLARSPDFDGLMALSAGTGPLQAIIREPSWLSLLKKSEEETAEIAKGLAQLQDNIFSLIGELIEETGKPILPVSVRFEYVGIKTFNGRSIPVYPTPERAVRTMVNLMKASRALGGPEQP